MSSVQNGLKRRQDSLLLFASAILIRSTLVGCGPSAASEELAAVDYPPLPADDWDVLTPAEQSLDPDRVAELYSMHLNWKRSMGCW